MTYNSNKFFWACDYKKNSGEGNLARMFINYIQHQTNSKFLKINGPKNFLFNHKYILPFIGIIYCWIYYFQKKEVYYINYLPFWNVFLFALLPPKTKLGPITGGANFSNKNYNIVRKIIFPFLYKISEFLINLRDHFIFSTDLLKKYLSKKTIKKSKFNFVFKFFKFEKKLKKKNIDFLIYYRNHPNKNHVNFIKLIKKLIIHNYDVRIVGDHLNLPKVKNYGYISNLKVKNLLKKTFFTLTSSENIYTLYILESIHNNVKIIIDKKTYKNLKYFKKSFFQYEINKINEINRIKKN